MNMNKFVSDSPLANHTKQLGALAPKRDADIVHFIKNEWFVSEFYLFHYDTRVISGTRT